MAWGCMVNWSFLLLWPSQRTLYISTRLVAQEIRQSWSHFVAARRSLPQKTDAGPIFRGVTKKLWEMRTVNFTLHWKFALFVLILSANLNVTHWTLFTPSCTLHQTILTTAHSVMHVTEHFMLHTAHSFDLLFVQTGCRWPLCWPLFFSASEVRATMNNRMTGGQSWFLRVILAFKWFRMKRVKMD